MGEYLARTKGKSLGIVTTADVFDATPGALRSHTVVIKSFPLVTHKSLNLGFGAAPFRHACRCLMQKWLSPEATAICNVSTRLPDFSTA